ncbi:restriction endonuclease [Myxosarcina sp. GI1(2024)]
MTAQRLTINDPTDFESVVARYFQQDGYEVIMPPANTKGYDIELQKGDECIAVQVKNHRAKCNVAQIRKFQQFIQLPLADKFTKGWFISASSFFIPALTHVHTEQPENLRLGIFEFESDRIEWVYPG